WVFVNPSIGEGWSISVIEANIHGAPAVAFDVPGLSESIQHAKTGFLVHSNQELIDSIILLLKNKKLRTTMSNSAKKWANTFNWDRAARESIALIKDL